VSDLDQKRLDVAKEMHQKDHDRAKRAYERATEAADEKLRRVYEQLIRTYESRNDTQTAEALRTEMNETVGQAAESQSPAVRGHIELIESIGPMVQAADGSKHDARKLASSRYMLLYFSAHWCPP